MDSSPAGPKSRKRFPPVYFFVLLLFMFLLHAFLPVTRILQGPARYLGLLPILAGIGAAIWSRRLFARAGTTIKLLQESSELIVQGPYRFTRNPIYVSMILVLIGTALLLGSLSPWFVIPILTFILHRFIRVEEDMLQRTFGDRYRTYQVRVRRWI